MMLADDTNATANSELFQVRMHQVDPSGGAPPDNGLPQVSLPTQMPNADALSNGCVRFVVMSDTANNASFRLHQAFMASQRQLTSQANSGLVSKVKQLLSDALTKGSEHVYELLAFSAPPWLNKVYEQIAADSADDALDTLFQEIDQLYASDQIPTCNALLREGVVSFERLGPSGIIGLASITLPLAQQLTHRDDFVRRAKTFLSQSIGHEELDNLFDGLESKSG